MNKPAVDVQIFKKIALFFNIHECLTGQYLVDSRRRRRRRSFIPYCNCMSAHAAYIFLYYFMIL